MWGHAASLYSFGPPRPQVLFYQAAPCQYPSGPSLDQRFLPVEGFGISPCWNPTGAFLHLSTIFFHFFQLLHFQSNTIGLPYLLCSWGSGHSAEPLSSSQTQYSWSSLRMSLMCQPGSSTNTRLLQVRTWSPTMSAFRLPPQPCWGQPSSFPDATAWHSQIRRQPR